jgi:hypothetical protein
MSIFLNQTIRTQITCFENKPYHLIPGNTLLYFLQKLLFTNAEV